MCLKLKLSNNLVTKCKAVVDGKTLTVLYSISGSIAPVYIRKRLVFLFLKDSKGLVVLASLSASTHFSTRSIVGLCSGSAAQQ